MKSSWERQITVRQPPGDIAKADVVSGAVPAEKESDSEGFPARHIGCDGRSGLFEIGWIQPKSKTMHLGDEEVGLEGCPKEMKALVRVASSPVMTRFVTKSVCVMSEVDRIWVL
jgi:hypothetical protein